MNKPIYLHVFDRELRTLTKAQLSDKDVCNIVITASLLSDVIYMSNSNLMESFAEFPQAVSLVYELEKLYQAKILVTSDNPEEFIEKRKKLYQAVKDRYPMYFNDDVIKFPSIPYVLSDSTTEFLRNRMLSETKDAVPIIIRDKYDEFRRILSSRDDNGVTINILDKYLNLISPESRYAANLISESYTVRYLNVMDGYLMKNVPGLCHFDYLSDGNLFYDCYYPVLENVILKFMRDENGNFFNDIAYRIATFKSDDYFCLFMGLLQQTMNSLHEEFERRERNSKSEQYVLLLWRQAVNKYLINPFYQIRELNIRMALQTMIRVKDRIEKDYNLKIEIESKHIPDMKNVLYVVATPTELKKVADYYKSKGIKLFPITKESHTYWDLGIIRHNHVFLVKCEMGAKKPNASILTINDAIKYLNPDYIVMVGIAFALKEDKLKIGDVMVATELQDYGSIKKSNGEIIERGLRVAADKTLLDRFTNAIVNWSGADIRFGLMITNDVLIDDKSFVEELRSRFPDAMGGEMEGCGLLANYQTPWILVKAVCDYGYHKGDEAQVNAALNAIKYVDYVLNEFDL